MTRSREVQLKRRPVGLPKPDDFQIVDVDVGAPGAGEVLVRNVCMRNCRRSMDRTDICVRSRDRSMRRSASTYPERGAKESWSNDRTTARGGKSGIPATESTWCQ